MNSRLQSALLFSLICLFVVPACSTTQQQEVGQAQRVQLYELKSERVKSQVYWSLSGKLAISDGKDGGSGKFNWHSGPDSNRMDFHGAMGRGAWRLEADGQGARLELADGTIDHARSVDLLVQSQLGWDIPVDSLSWWVRGLAAPGAIEQREIDGLGNLNSLVQDGWSIEFGSYRSIGDVDLPLKLTAQQADWKVKLVVRDWEMAAVAQADD